MVASKVLLEKKTNNTSKVTPSTLDRMRSAIDLPSQRDLSAKPAADGGRATDSTAAADAVKQLFESRLHPLSSMLKSTATCDNFRELVFAFEADWKSLHQFRSEWMQLLSSLVHIDLSAGEELHGEALRRSRGISEAWVSELTSDLMWPLSIRSALDASLAPLPIFESREILLKNIDDTIRSMAAHMLYQLGELTERFVLGDIKWFGESACQYTYIDRSLASRTTGARKVGINKIDYEKRTAWQTQETSLTSERSLAIHVHDLVDVVSSPIGAGMAPIPSHVTEIIENVPVALRNDLRMVEGNLIRERCVAQDLGEEAWTVREDVTVRYHFDPAIVLADRYVLIGWADDPTLPTPSSAPHGAGQLKAFWRRVFE